MWANHENLLTALEAVRTRNLRVEAGALEVLINAPLSSTHTSR
jgi:hypothetical protein